MAQEQKERLQHIFGGTDEYQAEKPAKFTYGFEFKNSTYADLTEEILSIGFFSVDFTRKSV